MILTSHSCFSIKTMWLYMVCRLNNETEFLPSRERNELFARDTGCVWTCNTNINTLGYSTFSIMNQRLVQLCGGIAKFKKCVNLSVWVQLNIPSIECCQVVTRKRMSCASEFGRHIRFNEGSLNVEDNEHPRQLSTLKLNADPNQLQKSSLAAKPGSPS